MGNIFSKAISFVKENIKIVYSLFLFVVIPAAFFINNYITNSNYEKNIDQITQRKAVLAENIINNLVQGQISDHQALQLSVDKIIKENEDILSLSILKAQNEQGGFEVIASSDKSILGQRQDGNLENILAWNEPAGIASLQSDQTGRFWSVTKVISGDQGGKAGLVKMSFSLKNSDALISRTIYNSYIILIVTILAVVLLVANQARLLGYALTVTKLKEIDKMKDMFISMASHELRSPLTAIIGYVDLLKDKKELFADKESSRYIENISFSIQRLSNLVEDILEVSRIEGNRLPVEITDIDPDPVISQSVEEMRSFAMQKNLELIWSQPDSSAKIKADANRLKQVLVNLISNAIKYTEKGSVSVSTAVKNKEFLITVADTGIGISAEDQSKLFQKFSRIKNKRTMDIAGTGLGLWITLEIIRRMDGKISVESIEGVGSHFTVRFPAA